MFGLGFFEIAFIVLVAFLVFGPQQFPIVAKNFLQLLNELRSGFSKVQTELKDVQKDTLEYIDQIKKDATTQNSNKEKDKKP